MGHTCADRRGLKRQAAQRLPRHKSHQPDPLGPPVVGTIEFFVPHNFESVQNSQQFARRIPERGLGVGIDSGFNHDHAAGAQSPADVVDAPFLDGVDERDEIPLRGPEVELFVGGDDGP